MIKFGPSGNSSAFANAGFTKSEDSATWVRNLGLSCFEYSFGRGVSLTDERAVSIGNAFKQVDVEISVHAPYYINFANPEAEKFFNIAVQPEKDIVLIVVPSEIKEKLMKALYTEVGLDSPGQGIAFSLPIDSAVGLAKAPVVENVETNSESNQEN